MNIVIIAGFVFTIVTGAFVYFAVVLLRGPSKLDSDVVLYSDIAVRYDAYRNEYYSFIFGDEGYKKFTGYSRLTVADEAREYRDGSN